MSETIVAFARWCLCGTETAIAFAGENWAFLVQLSGAVVMSVSQLPRGCVLCAKKFALLGLMVGVSAKKFALRTKNGPKLAFSGVLGEFFRGNVAGGALLGEFFRGPAVVGSYGASCVAPWAWSLGPSTGSVNPSMRS